jgi:hypothetical protein
VRPTTSADVNVIMASLTNGNTGGLASNPSQGSTPAPTMVDTQSLSELISDANATQIQGEIQEQLETPTTTQPQPIPPETVVLPSDLSLRALTAPDYYVANQRSFWSPGLFISNPGAHGILGGDDTLIPCFLARNVCNGSPYGFFRVQTDDFNVQSDSIADGRIKGTIPPLIERTGFNWWGPTYGKTPEAEFDFPIFNVVGVHAVTDAVAIEVIDGGTHTTTLVGSAFTGRGGGFFAYQLFEVGENGLADLNKPVLAFGGTPFQKPEEEPDQLRLFNLYTDPGQNISIPFAAKETSPTNLAGATIQPLYLLESSGDSENPGRSVWLQTSFLIKGDGPTQETILVLALGEQTDEDQLEGFRRGTSHINLLLDHDNNSGTPLVNRGMQTINLTGQISTLAGADGETYMFGDQLPHFIIGADSTGNGHNIFQDQPLHPEAWAQTYTPPIGGLSTNALYEGPPPSITPPPSAFMGATYHIGAQAGQIAAPQPVATDPEGLDFYGYAAGVYQQTPDNLGPNEEPVGILANANPEQVHLKFKDENRLSAFFDLTGAGEGGGGGARLAFGDWDGASGRSAVINGNIYAAIESGTVASTAIVDGASGQQTRFADTSLYLVSGGLLHPTDPNAPPCAQCDFIKWGSWGGQIEFKDDVWNPVTAQVNLGWYVAGDISTQGDVDSFTALGPTATFSGEAIGDVAALNQTGLWDTYVATGDVNMTWTFANRSGNLAITNFDATGPYGPLNVSGVMEVPGELSSVDLNKFEGPLTGSLGPQSAAGFAQGSFVRNGADPMAGAIGNWHAGNTGETEFYKATGVFAAGRR